MVRPGTGGSSPDGPRFSGSAVPAKTRLLPQDRPEQAEKPAEKAPQNNRNSPQGSRRSISRKPQRADIRPLFFGSLARRWAGGSFLRPARGCSGLPIGLVGRSRSSLFRCGNAGSRDAPSGPIGFSSAPRDCFDLPGRELARAAFPEADAGCAPLTAARCPRYGRTGYPGTRRWPGAGYRRRSCGPPPGCSPG